MRFCFVGVGLRQRSKMYFAAENKKFKKGLAKRIKMCYNKNRAGVAQG